MNENTPKYLIVVEKIKQSIKRKEITEKLPGERILAKEFGYSYMTIRKAIETLVNEGILYKVPTKGTYVMERNSAKKATMVIGYFLDSSIVSGLTSPYYSLIFNALEKQASKHGYSLIYFSDVGDSSSFKHMNKIDGVIVSCFPRIETLVHELNDHVPVVAIDNSPSDKTIPSVIIDNFNAVSGSVDYLCKLGHSRIGFMTGLADSDVGRNRLAGFVDGLRTHSIKTDDDLIFRGNYSFESGSAGADHFLALDNPPTAIMCANDTMAIAAIRNIIQSGLNVPEDISVMGFDDIVVSAQITPPLTTVAAPIKQIAKHAFQLLEDLVHNRQIDNRHIALPGKLIKRNSCAQVISNGTS